MINIHILKASGRLNPFSEAIQKETQKAIKKIKAKISFQNVDIVFLDNQYRTIPEIGIGGHTLNENMILINLGPRHKDFKSTVSKEIARTLYHESLHVVRWENPGYGKTLLEVMISEGLADHFELELSGEKPELWDRVLDKKQIKLFLKKAEKEFKNKNYSHRDWFFGSKKRGIPRWTAYSLGFYLVGEYLKRNPNKKASTLYSTKASEIKI